ncbi:MAG: bifunctional 2-polyprenyl-6-hydroxyphenol methylase/3-demethylubiquinol 3-O-methyltransferase UbiG [Zoogloeaceae bacterium]|nr:bifunctional 2-polyprenyl-6-hydroxyphenol methylase/3-demethylubiquinol 3-O-methyltransferase UbiG [Zoogloeaceae bacterium]
MLDAASVYANADPGELAKFSELAHYWWDAGGALRPLHEINPLRLDWMETFASFSGKKVLDIGCGGGLLSEGMAARGADVLGIDLAEKLLAVARLHLLESGQNVTYRQVSAENLAKEQPGAFDYVTCLEMLEHVPEPGRIVAAAARLLKPGGMVFFATLNRNVKSWLFAVLGAEYLLGLLPKGTHDHARFIRPSELARWCRDEGLEISASTGLAYQPFTRRYHLTSSLDVNYLLAAVRT